jgi:hypothetical protein
MGQQADRCHPGLHCALGSEHPALLTPASPNELKSPTRAGTLSRPFRVMYVTLTGRTVRIRGSGLA